MRKLLFLTTLALFAGSCDGSEDEPLAGPLLTVSVDAEYKTADTDNFLIVHSRSGALLSHKAFEAGETISIPRPKGFGNEQLTATLIYLEPDPERNYYTIKTYMGITAGRNLHLKQPNESATNITGTGAFTVRATSLPPLDQYSITNRLSRSCSGSGTLGSIEVECQRYEEAPRYIFQFSTKDSDPRYSLIDNPASGAVYEIDYADMSPFDEVVEFTFPPSSDVFYYNMGRESNQSYAHSSYLLSYHIGSDTHDTIKLGYLNFLSKYSTFLRLGFEGYGYSYFHQGSIPSGQIDWPALTDYSLTSESINNFSANAKKPYDYRRSFYFRSGNGSPGDIVSWNVYSPYGEDQMGDLPADFAAAHPSLDYSNMVHAVTDFFMDSGGYANAVDQSVQNTFDGEFTRLSISIY